MSTSITPTRQTTATAEKTAKTLADGFASMFQGDSVYLREFNLEDEYILELFSNGKHIAIHIEEKGGAL